MSDKGHLHYVCGFVFDSTCNNVALMRMRRGPDASFVGSLNGFGGKFTGGSARRTMSERFEAQAGRAIPAHEWHHFHTETMLKKTPHATIYYLAAKVEMFGGIQGVSDEPVFLVPTETRLRAEALLAAGESLQEVLNLSYIIPMARHWLMYPHLRFTN